jgi:hypothetical protein
MRRYLPWVAPALAGLVLGCGGEAGPGIAPLPPPGEDAAVSAPAGTGTKVTGHRKLSRSREAGFRPHPP